MSAKRMALLAGLFLLASTLHRGGNPGRGSAEPFAGFAATGLWQKAVTIHRQNRAWYPERITILSEVMNRRGRPSSVTQLFFSLRPGANGRLVTELTRSLKNGADTTSKMKEKVRIIDPWEREGPGNEDSYSISFSDSPFVPEKQHAVAFSPGGERLLLFGHSCQRFDFSYRTSIVRKGESEELIWNGMAWLEEGSGLPVKLEFTLTPLPGRIHSLWAIYLYDTARRDKWVLNKVTITGQGGILFIRKKFRTTTTFHHYRLPPVEAGAR